MVDFHTIQVSNNAFPVEKYKDLFSFAKGVISLGKIKNLDTYSIIEGTKLLMVGNGDKFYFLQSL